MAKVVNILGSTGGGGGLTNLTYIASPIDGTIDNSNGSDAIIPLVDDVNAGLMSPGEHIILSNLDDNFLHTTGDEVKDGTLTLNDAFTVNDSATINGNLILPPLSSVPGDVNNLGIDELGVVTVIPTGGGMTIPVRNTSGSTLVKGTAVYVDGASGNRALVKPAIADTDIVTSRVLGLITSNIPNNNNGTVTTDGVFTQINTDTFPAGSPVFLSDSSAGELTITPPTSPNAVIPIGTVTNSHPTQGSILLNIQIPFKIDHLTDVAATAPNDNDILRFNATTGLWESVPRLIDGVLKTIDNLPLDDDLRIISDGTNIPSALLLSTYDVTSNGIAGIDTNTAFGEFTLNDLNLTGGNNTALGYAALNEATGGMERNTAIGAYAMSSSITGVWNTAVGTIAGGRIQGNYNTAIGEGAMYGEFVDTTGSQNICIGFQAGRAVSSGSNNILIENITNASVTTGSGNIIINPRQKAGISTGSNNVIIGGYDGHILNTTGEIHIGTGALNTTRLSFNASGQMRIHSTPDTGAGGAADNILVRTVADGMVKQIAISSIGGTTETASNGLTKVVNDIQLGGTLTAHTTITGGTRQLRVTANSDTTPALYVDNAGGREALFVQNTNASSTSAGISVWGANTGGGIDILMSGGSGPGINSFSQGTGVAVRAYTTNTAPGLAIDATVRTSSGSTQNTVRSVARFTRDTTGIGQPGDGIGGSIEMYLDTSGGASIPILSNNLISKWTTVNEATRVSEFSIQGVSNAITNTLFTIGGNGLARLNMYGGASGPTGAGSAAWALNIDTSGNIVQSVIPSGGGGTTETASNGLTKTVNDIKLGGTLTASTFINATGTNNLHITGSNTVGSNVGLLNMTNSGAGGAALRVTNTNAAFNAYALTVSTAGSAPAVDAISATGNGIIGTGYVGVRGVSNNASGTAGLYGEGNGGPFPIYGVDTTSGAISVVKPILRMERNGIATGENGCGVSIECRYPAAGGSTFYMANALTSRWLDATERNSEFVIDGHSNSGLSSVFSVLGTGKTRLYKYGIGSFTTGTATYNLVVDGSGNIMEAALGAGSTDTNAVHLTGNETITNGIKTINASSTTGLSFNSTAGSVNSILMTNSGSFANSIKITTSSSGGAGIDLTNNSGNYGYYANNTSTGSGFRVSNFNGKGVYVDNQLGTGNAIYISNGTNGNTSGDGLVINGGTGSTAKLYVGQNNGTETFSITKTGVITGASIVLGGSATSLLAANGSAVTAGTGITISGGVISSAGSGTTPTIDQVLAAGNTAIGKSIVLDDGATAIASISPGQFDFIEESSNISFQINPFGQGGTDAAGRSNFIDFTGRTQAGEATFRFPDKVAGPYVLATTLDVGVTGANNGLTLNGANAQLGGTLLADTTVALSTFKLFFTSASVSGASAIKMTGANSSAVTVLELEGHSANATIYATNGGTGGTGNAVFAVAGSGIGVRGDSSTSNGVYATSNTGIPIALNLSSNTLNSVLTTLSLSRSPNVGNGADGIGQQIEFYTKTSTQARLINSIISKYVVATDASRVSEFIIRGDTSTTFNDILTLRGSGLTRLNGYGVTQPAGTVGTATYSLNVDASGNIVQGSIAGANDPVQVVVTTSAGITSSTLATGGYVQHGKNVIIDNGASSISYTIQDLTFTASFMKLGTGPISFVFASPITALVAVDGTPTLDGIVGSTATVAVHGTTAYLRISNA